MKLKNKVLWDFAGGILLVLLLFLEQQFFQTRKKQIAVILSEDAVSDFCAFQEGIYDGAEDCAVSPIIYRIILFQTLLHRLRNSHTLCLRGICGNFERTLCCLLDLRG